MSGTSDLKKNLLVIKAYVRLLIEYSEINT